jgi:aerobic carbon-monoxide dehydrogenase large subunit
VKFGIGQPLKRYEDARLLTGGGRYTDDVQLPGQAFAYVLRSPVAHAALRRLDATAARAMAGVRLVLTGEDVRADGLGDIPCQHPLPGRKDTPRPALAIGKVRHVGQPVALVVADSLEEARDAAEAIEAEYDELPAVADVRAALAPGAPQLFDRIPGNLVFDWDNDQTDKAATDAAFARAARVTALELVNNRVVVNSMEPRNAVADYDPQSDRSTLYTSTQGPHLVRDPVAAALKLPKEKLRCVTLNVGGAFGMKAFIYPEQVLVVWASRKLRRPVRWQADRSEGFLSDNQGRDHWSRAELAMDERGRFLGLRVETLTNLGAYLSPVGSFVPTRSSDMVAGLYATPAIHVNVKGVCTNTVPVCAYRGAGRPEAAYLIERLVDAAARDMGMTPDAIRRLNFIAPEAMPFTTATKVTYDSGEFAALMDACMQAADWEGFEARRAASERAGKLRGRGMATYTERCGGGMAEQAQLRFRDDRIELVMGNVEYGTGLITSYKQVVAEGLGVHPDRVEVAMGDTDRTPAGLTGGSRALPVGGAAIHYAAAKVVEKGRRLAAHLLEAAVEDVEFADAAFRIVGTDRSVELFALAAAARDPARLPEGMEPGLDAAHEHAPEGATFPNGCHIVELEIDPETGEIEIDRYTVVDDFGRIVNPLTLEGQVHGGIAQGLGQALLEQTVYEEGGGQLLTGSFMDYALPRASDFPAIAFATRNVPCKANPLGVKGAGEAGAIGAPPAAMNAIVDALWRARGVRNLDMPATPRRVWEALNG